MLSLDLPGEIKRNKLIRALQRLGFVIDTKGGKGSHIKIIWPRTEKCLTIPQSLPKQTLHYIFKEIEEMSGVTWNEIKNEL